MPAVEGTATTTTWTVRTNLPIPYPTGVQAGEKLVAVTVIGSGSGEANDPTPPGGFAAIPGTWPAEVTLGGFNLELRVFEAVAAGTETGDATFSHDSGESQGAMFRVSDAGDFAAVTTVNTGTTADSTFTGLTTTEDGSLVLLFHADFGDTGNNLTPPTGSTPTFSEVLDTGATGGLLYIAAGALATAGATGDKTFVNNSNTGNSWIAVMAAVEPAAAAELPVNTVAPAVTGTAQVGETLSCSTGTWDNSPTSYSYQWQRLT